MNNVIEIERAPEDDPTFTLLVKIAEDGGPLATYHPVMKRTAARTRKVEEFQAYPEVREVRWYGSGAKMLFSVKFSAQLTTPAMAENLLRRKFEKLR